MRSELNCPIPIYPVVKTGASEVLTKISVASKMLRMRIKERKVREKRAGIPMIPLLWREWRMEKVVLKTMDRKLKSNGAWI